MGMGKLFGGCRKCLTRKSSPQKHKGRKKFSLSLLASYLIIMVAPTIAIVIIYFMARGALLDVQKEKAHRLLSESVITFDQNIEEIKNVGSFVAGNNDLIEFQKESHKMTREQKFYALYLFAKSYPNYPMMNQAINNVYILIRDAGYIVQVPSVVPETKTGLASLASFHGYSFDELIDKFGENYTYGTYTSFENPDGNWNQTEIALVQSLPKTTQQSEEGAVLITLDKKNLDSLLDHALIDVSGKAFIVNSEGEIISSVGVKAGSTGTKWSDYKRAHKGRESYYTDSLSSNYSGCRFITITPEEALLSKIDNIKYIIVILCIISVGIGLLICFMYWYRRRSMVQRYLLCVEGMETDSKQGQTFWGSLNHFLDNVENLQTTVTRQQRIVQKELLRKLLYGKYDSRKELEADIGDDEKLFLRISHFYIVRLDLKDTFKDNLYDSKTKLAEDIQFHFAKYMDHVHWIYGISHLSYAIIIAHEGDLRPEAVKKEFEKWNYLLYKERAIPIFTGISASQQDIMQMHSAFEEASSIAEYAGFMGIHAPLLKADIPERKENAVFSIDMEMQLEQTIRSGTEEGLEKILGDIGEYYLNCFQEFSMMQHVLEILRCTVMRSLEKGKKGDQFDQIRKDVKKAERPEEIFELIRRAKQYYSGNKKVLEEEEELLLKKRLEDFIDENYTNPRLNLANMVDEFRISERRLAREFRDYFGVTFSEYLERIRIHNACEFLRKGMTVKRIASAVGYNSDYSFRRAFRRVTGLNPSQFQKIL